MSTLLFLKKEIQFIAAFFVIFLIGIGMIYSFAIAPPQNFEVDNLVILSRGATLQEVANQLHRERVISSPRIFARIVVLYGGEQGVQAGSYYFEKPENAFRIAERLIEGDQGLDPIRVTIPEGVTRDTIADLFSDKFERFNKNEFLVKTADSEGYLFPDTYFFFPDTTADDVIERMRQNFRDRTVEIYSVIESSDRSLQDIITMASIVEAEAYEFQDMRKIAGVLWKRLEIGMPLQVDVTFRYINGKGTFDLTYEDLALDSPYNTYVYTGLPPTPISNPGLDAIIATLDYVESDYLFFLADNSGTVHYSEDFEEHKRKKALYLQ